LSVDDLFTHTFTLEAATDAYRLLDERKAEAVQVLFRYD